MRSGSIAKSLLPLLSLLATPGEAVVAAEPPPQILIDTPRGLDVSTSPGGTVFLTGRLPSYHLRAGLDLMLVIDVSDSTDEPLASSPAALRLEAHPSLWERILESLRGPLRARPESTLLAEEIRLARSLLAELDPRATRVGLVAVGGDPWTSTPDAWTLAPLSSGLGSVDRGLAQLLERGPRGLTNLDSGVHRAMAELLATPSATSKPRERASRAVLVLTDGVGPARFETSSESYASRQSRRTERAARAEIRVDLVVVGEEAGRQPPARAWPDATGGQLVSVPDRAPLDLLARSLVYGESRSLAVRNLTSGAEVSSVEITPDGGFACLVHLLPGLNRVELTAELPQGSVSRILELRNGGAEAPALSPRQLAQRNRLLGDHLRGLHAERAKLANLPARRRHLEVAVPAAAAPAAD